MGVITSFEKISRNSPWLMAVALIKTLSFPANWNSDFPCLINFKPDPWFENFTTTISSFNSALLIVGPV